MSRIGVSGGPVAAVAAACVALALASCGDDSGSASGARGAVPADAVLYAEATIRPEGDQRADLDALLDRFGGVDPGALIISQLDSAAAESGVEFSFSEDVEPWLGERASVFFTALEDNGDGTVLLESTDDEAALAAIERLYGSSGGATEKSYAGHDYFVGNEDDGVSAVDDGLVIVGTEPGLEAVFDTIDGGPALAADAAFTAQLSTDELDDSFASLYVDVNTAVAAGGGIEPSQQALLDSLAPKLLESPVSATVDLGADQVSVDVGYGSLGAFAFAYTGGASSLLRELPGDAWGATATADVGAAYSSILEAVTGGQIPGADTAQLDAFRSAVEVATGASLETVLGAIGDVGAFIRGDGPQSLDGAAVIEITDAGLAPKLLDAARRGLASQPGVTVRPVEIAGASGFSLRSPAAPMEIDFVTNGERAVIGYGRAATEAALQPDERLGDSDAFGSATAAFGEDPPLGTIVDVGSAVQALAVIGGADPASLALVQPYLDQFSYFAAGSSDDGESGHTRIAIGLADE